MFIILAPQGLVTNRVAPLDMNLTHILDRNRRTPCFPQIDLAFRAILFEKRPPFIVLFSHQTMSYSQILFANSLFVPSKDVYFDFPSGCPNPGCTDNCCELVRFPKKGLETAAVLCDKRKVRYRYGRRARPRELCNWIECDVCFDEAAPGAQMHEGGSGSEGSSSEGGSEGSVCYAEARFAGLICSRCKLVKYCSPEHQKLDWEEHRRVCVKPGPPLATESEAQ